MHSKRRYKICICSVILGELESFQYSKGFFIIFLKILDINYLTYYDSEKFSDSSPYIIFDPKILGFLFLRKIS